ncbi:hypothetical protein Q3G72_025814 [Acer saccharum]|nr:hypothetical protein Q3G72_025814 [Acer saccharum]
MIETLERTKKNDDDDDHHNMAFAKKEDEDVLVPTKHQSKRNAPASSKISGGSSPSLPEAVQEHQEP